MSTKSPLKQHFDILIIDIEHLLIRTFVYLDAENSPTSNQM